MSLMKVAGGCLIGRKLLQGPQFVQIFSGTNSGSRLLNRQIQSQLRYFRGQARDGNGKKVGLVPDVKVAPADQVGKGLAKPIAFTIGFCTCSFAGAAIWQYETMRNRTKRAWERSVSALRDQWSFPNKYASWRTEFHGRWRKLSDAEKLTLGLLGANALVFLLWRVPRLQPMMTKYFCSNPAARAVCWPMVLSTFSHYSFWHLFINMYVLYSFSNGIGNVLGHEQFLAMYLSAGVVSSLASYVHKIITVRPGLSLGAVSIYYIEMAFP
ncbi:Rho- GTP-binding protein RhoN, variant 3 [Chamberlinius hualienensis]